MQLTSTGSACAKGSRAAGFTLIEVLVTLVVLAIGLLGVAKLQAAAIANTQLSRVRSLVALQVGSLAAAMHANPGYWAVGAAPTIFGFNGSTVTDGTGALTTPPPASCVSAGAACTPSQIAALDVQTWAANLSQLLPSYAATVSCTANPPVGCQISLTWAEKYVATNNNTLSTAQTATSSFTMFVAP